MTFTLALIFSSVIAHRGILAECGEYCEQSDQLRKVERCWTPGLLEPLAWVAIKPAAHADIWLDIPTAQTVRTELSPSLGRKLALFACPSSPRFCRQTSVVTDSSCVLCG
ncbi:hypothetical protein RSOLAG1IB_11996 [Rhizoctonia solani AG-1 IB]|uniref:Secreted protein n=1 Tax=Thanatephorus cucumeris (strain AG1-IB / isolate 7/3/14) TaxID=1108050 RepID=A0A0B7FKH3_THACB|nr:hypothetical protein RSOLAG1IB_11996 [Rhizoctonia solani AG-1 IB]